ncbi:hypothetical protein [Ruegeria sp. HKCCA4008]|uniref:hypothetical protein n=1 Tax=Ruegeria sp. HKCCA4008 TaxID=2682999 RepID=UPI0020C41E91|nr:hypothetical protein [Ruegeria sp. HKCCA4008]
MFCYGHLKRRVVRRFRSGVCHTGGGRKTGGKQDTGTGSENRKHWMALESMAWLVIRASNNYEFGCANLSIHKFLTELLLLASDARLHRPGDAQPTPANILRSAVTFAQKSAENSPLKR